MPAILNEIKDKFINIKKDFTQPRDNNLGLFL